MIERPPRLLHPVLWIAFTAAAAFFARGYSPYVMNHSVQVPLVHRFNDPSAYPGDAMVDTLQYYAAVLWWLAAWCARSVPLDTVMLAGFVLGRVLLVIAGWMLGRAFAPESRLAPYATAAWAAVGPVPLLAGGTIAPISFEHTSFAIALLLMALACVVRRRYIAAGLLAGLGAAVNPMYGVFAAVYGLAFLVANPPARAHAARLIAGAVLAAVVALPVAVLLTRGYAMREPDSAEWVHVLGLVQPVHFFPDTWTKGLAHVQTAVLIGVLLVSLRVVRPLVRGLSRTILAATVAAFAWCVLGILAAYVWKSPSLLVLHPFRALDFWFSLAGTGAIAAAAVGLESAPERRPFSAAMLLSGLAICGRSPLWLVAALAVIPLIPPLAIRIRALKPGSMIVGIAALVAAVVVGDTVLRARPENRFGLAGAVPTEPEKAAAEWARANTRPEDIFLVPLWWGSFRPLACRPVFVVWSDALAIPWQRAYAHEWASRMRLLGIEINDYTRKRRPKRPADLDVPYSRLTDADAEKLAKEYGIRYWIVPIGHASSWREVHRTRSHVVLESPAAARQAASFAASGPPMKRCRIEAASAPAVGAAR